MGFKDLRQFIAALEKTGDVVKIQKEVDWDLELGAIGRRAYELSQPAQWFQKIKDYPAEYTVFNGSVGTWRRLAIALGLPPETPVRELYDVYEKREQKPIKPKMVKTGECKDNITTGDKIDLYKLPTPMLHDGDGGRYLGTWDVVVSKDPETNWSNWGMYRFMIHDKNTLTGYPAPFSHLAMMLMRRYIPNKKPMPIAIVIGCEPMCHMVATAGYGINVDEADYAGALGQAPVELVKCETSDLMVPAHSEIVIEGEILPDQTAPEGPFGEYPGYRSGQTGGGLLCRVNAITHRNSPIMTVIALGTPPDDSSIGASLTAGVAMKRRLLRHGIEVTGVYVPPEGVTHLIVVGVKKGGGDVARQIIEIFTARRAMTSKVIVVDEDVDPFNMGEVLHAFATKCHPGKGIYVTTYEGRANALTPCYSPEERRKLTGAGVAFDSTWPLEWDRDTEVPIKSSFTGTFSKETQQKVLKNWKSYGFK